MGNWGSISLGIWETELYQTRGRKLGDLSTIFQSFSDRGLPPEHLWPVLCIVQICRAVRLQSAEETAEDYGRAPRKPAALCFHKLGTSSILTLNLTEALMCNSEFGITGLMHYDRVLKDARNSHYEMNEKVD